VAHINSPNHNTTHTTMRSHANLILHNNQLNQVISRKILVTVKDRSTCNRKRSSGTQTDPIPSKPTKH